MSLTNHIQSQWKRLQEKCNAFAIAMDYDPTQYLIERNRILEREIALLKNDFQSYEPGKEISRPGDDLSEIQS